MGRKRSTPTNLPPNVHIKGRTYYFVIRDGGNRLWIHLGQEADIALVRAAKLRLTRNLV